MYERSLTIFSHAGRTNVTGVADGWVCPVVRNVAPCSRVGPPLHLVDVRAGRQPMGKAEAIGRPHVELVSGGIEAVEGGITINFPQPRVGKLGRIGSPAGAAAEVPGREADI